MKKKVSRGRGPLAWNRYRKDRQFYFAYPPDRPNTWKLLDSGNYGIVQLVCIDNTARAAFMAGFRAGKQSTSNAEPK